MILPLVIVSTFWLNLICFHSNYIIRTTESLTQLDFFINNISSQRSKVLTNLHSGNLNLKKIHLLKLSLKPFEKINPKVKLVYESLTLISNLIHDQQRLNLKKEILSDQIYKMKINSLKFFEKNSLAFSDEIYSLSDCNSYYSITNTPRGICNFPLKKIYVRLALKGYLWCRYFELNLENKAFKPYAIQGEKCELSTSHFSFNHNLHFPQNSISSFGKSL